MYWGPMHSDRTRVRKLEHSIEFAKLKRSRAWLEKLSFWALKPTLSDIFLLHKYVLLCIKQKISFVLGAISSYSQLVLGLIWELKSILESKKCPKSSPSSILHLWNFDAKIVTKQVILISFRFILFSKFWSKCVIQNIKKLHFECSELILAFGKETDLMFDFDVVSPQPYSQSYLMYFYSVGPFSALSFT